jgi:hypothetical protein
MGNFTFFNRIISGFTSINLKLNGLRLIIFPLFMIFKVIFGSEIHVVKSTNKEKFTQFIKLLPSLFKSLPAKFKLSYLDEEGDEITFEDQNDYDVLLGTEQKSVKILIR